MKFNVKCVLLMFFLIFLYYWFFSYSDRSTLESKFLKIVQQKKASNIVIVVVACKDRATEALNMIKSAIIFNTDRKNLRFVVISEVKLFLHFEEKLEMWKEDADFYLNYEIHPITFPKPHEKVLKELFKPCASQRLFLPSLLKHIDAVLYVDSDVIFSSQPSEIWNIFSKFNESQIAAVAPETEDRNAGWYNRFARHPFYGELGINSGVMLMNLTRMRSKDIRWDEEILEIYNEYKLNLVWGDQDILNIYFSFHGEKLYIFPCEWNYRADHCMYMSICDAPTGIKLIHGNRGYFHNQAQPIFKSFYSAIEEYQFGSNPYRNIVKNIEYAMTVQTSNCDKIYEKFLISPKKLFKSKDEFADLENEKSHFDENLIKDLQ